ncbi:MAG: VOC family protein [Verrucomicrobiota bacterium]
MKISGILETCIYASDLEAMRRFYSLLPGLSCIGHKENEHVFFKCGEAYLLIFNPKSTENENGEVNGDPIPCHGAYGPSHVAFAIHSDDVKTWRAWLMEHSILIESEVTWPSGGRSLYFRDPAGNSIEVAEPRIWQS